MIGFLADEISQDNLDDLLNAIEELTLNSPFISITTFTSALACIILVIFFIKLHRGYTVSQHLGVHQTSFKTVLMWIGITFLVMIIMQLLGYLF
ncbi:MAG: hypothetical protein SVM79_05525 [Chloroflexota bacterium]|nr:hypothetical protein [Chloroflexota bacterium]